MSDVNNLAALLALKLPCNIRFGKVVAIAVIELLYCGWCPGGFVRLTSSLLPPNMCDRVDQFSRLRNGLTGSGY